jgi:hypothetical protein
MTSFRNEAEQEKKKKKRRVWAYPMNKYSCNKVEKRGSEHAKLLTERDKEEKKKKKKKMQRTELGIVVPFRHRSSIQRNPVRFVLRKRSSNKRKEHNCDDGLRHHKVHKQDKEKKRKTSSFLCSTK